MTFLERMAAASRERVRAARARGERAALERRAHARRARRRRSMLDRFDVIAELKLRSPAAGGLAERRLRPRRAARKLRARRRRGRLRAHGAHGVPRRARRISSTRPTLLAPTRRPAMRKDFLTDPYQVLEARAAGAGGVLVIVAMLDDATVRALVDCARRCGLFVLLEAFDRADLERLAPYDEPQRGGPPVLAGVNCRDLRDLDVRFERFAELAPHLPRHLPTVAESGIGSVADDRDRRGGRVSPGARRLVADARRGSRATLVARATGSRPAAHGRRAGGTARCS